MIQSNELRIGNYFKAEPYSFDILQVKALGTQWVIIDNGSLFYKSIQPIPLTEEWLLKFGFKEISFTQDRNRDWYKMFEIDYTSELVSLNYYTKTNYCRFNFDIGYGNKNVDLYYVHQLQNLYFALTNNELKIKTNE